MSVTPQEAARAFEEAKARRAASPPRAPSPQRSGLFGGAGAGRGPFPPPQGPSLDASEVLDTFDPDEEEVQVRVVDTCLFCESKL